MSETPRIAEKRPAAIELEPGDYYWCVCGHSSKQPFCDGSHGKTQGFRPMKVTITEKKKYYLCQCKQTANKPFCDGTHNRI
ncbi:MAG: hypothetical protein GMKNLPBB_02190 [Myxococcota bacterium]|nr:hypothetical protein [Myxococcota bacterium]